MKSYARPLALTIFLAPLAAFAAERKEPPNLVIVMADQWRAQATGYAGDPNVKTPHLDRLQREGIWFTHAFSSVPVCSPARACLMTGLRPLTSGIFVNDVPLSSGAVTMAEAFRGAGYDTGCIGKWHLDGHGRSNYIPPERRQGFEYWKVLECTHDYNHSFYYANGPTKLLWEGYDAIAQTHDAQQYLRARAGSRRPFFLYLAWGPPHDPYFTAPPKYRAMYRPEALTLRPNVPESYRQEARCIAAGYYAHCTALDDCVGSLRQTLHETGLEENTIFVFVSDHGDLLGSHGGRNKQQPYDESIRIPLLVRWPAGLGTKARQLGAPMTLEDLMPTLLALCGAKIPKGVEGRDFSDYVRGGKAPSDDAVLIGCAAPFGQWIRAIGGREYRGVRTARYTFVRDLKGPWLLFDNQADPYQMNNLVARPECAALRDELDAVLSLKLAESHDKFLPADAYLKKWGYKVDATGTVPYTP